MRLLEIVEVIEEAPDCFSYVFVPVDSDPFRYLPGQFLTFLVEINHREQRRPYSISATLNDGKHFRVTIKKVENGAVSRYIIDHWKSGSKVKVLEAAGRFVLPATSARGSQFVFIAAGSGLAPVFALLQSLIRDRGVFSILLVTQFRRENEIIFRDALRAWERDVAGFRWISFLSRPQDKKTPPQRLNNEKLTSLLPETPRIRWLTTQYYLCGPLAFMRMAAFTLRELGVPEQKIHLERFDPPREPPGWFTLDPTPHEVSLITGANKTQFTAAFPDSIMSAAAKAGIAIPFSCKAGICSTCMLRCISGSVKMRINEVLTDGDLREGLVLTCVGYATSDLVLINT